MDSSDKTALYLVAAATVFIAVTTLPEVVIMSAVVLGIIGFFWISVRSANNERDAAGQKSQK